MTREKAESLAKDCMKICNPECKPYCWYSSSDVSRPVYGYQLDENTELRISFYHDDWHGTGWCHLCEILADGKWEVAYLTGYGVDSIPNLTDTILDVCNDNGF